jgi:hypothetical protein
MRKHYFCVRAWHSAGKLELSFRVYDRMPRPYRYRYSTNGFGITCQIRQLEQELGIG